MKSTHALVLTSAALLLAGCGASNAAQADPLPLIAAECRHAPQASIYGVPSAMWLVQYSGSDAVESLSLTLWRPLSEGPDQISLHMIAGGRTLRISTVQGNATEGSAQVAIEAEGVGGRLLVDGRTADGARVDIAVRCPHFTALEAVGG